MPLARERRDAEYAAPLRDLRLHPETELYVGALHPVEDWIEHPVYEFGLHYDTVEYHGWYRNLDLTVDQLAGDLQEGQILIDYSGGTGILLDRLRLRIFDRQIGMLIVDSSPKFLRVALDRFRSDERVAFRRLRYLKEERRLQYVDEVVPSGFAADALVSTNAIHLYDDLEGTLRSWARVLRPQARVRINSGNLRNPAARPNEADVEEWYEFLAAYADAVLGWVGGSAKVDGAGASAEAAADRLQLLHDSLSVIFGGRPTFRCCWTYI